MDWHISQYIHKTMPALKQNECFFVIYNIMSQIINDTVIPKVNDQWYSKIPNGYLF